MTIIAKALILPLLLGALTIFGVKPLPKPQPKKCETCVHYYDDFPPCPKCEGMSLWRGGK